MPTLAQVRDRADTWLAARWPIVRDRQIAYQAANGRNFQGLVTHTNLPAHLTAAFADAIGNLLANHPTDSPHNWIALLPEIAGIAIPAAIVIDNYGGPEGQGFVVTVWCMYNGTIYSRSQNYGPETWRTVAWHVVTLDELQ